MAGDAKSTGPRLVSPLDDQPRQAEKLAVPSKAPHEMRIALVDRMANPETGHGQAILDAVAAALRERYAVEGAKVVVDGIIAHTDSEEAVLREFGTAYDAAVFAVGD